MAHPFIIGSVEGLDSTSGGGGRTLDGAADGARRALQRDVDVGVRPKRRRLQDQDLTFTNAAQCYPAIELEGSIIQGLQNTKHNMYNTSYHEKTKFRARGCSNDGAPTAHSAADGGRHEPGTGL
eukprot:scaffold1480_cov123-Isochrysis_galbana.AAC.1